MEESEEGGAPGALSPGAGRGGGRGLGCAECREPGRGDPAQRERERERGTWGGEGGKGAVGRGQGCKEAGGKRGTSGAPSPGAEGGKALASPRGREWGSPKVGSRSRNLLEAGLRVSSQSEVSQGPGFPQR